MFLSAKLNGDLQFQQYLTNYLMFAFIAFIRFFFGWW